MKIIIENKLDDWLKQKSSAFSGARPLPPPPPPLRKPQKKSGLSSAVQSLHRLAPGLEGDGSFNNLISQKIVIIGKN